MYMYMYTSEMRSSGYPLIERGHFDMTSCSTYAESISIWTHPHTVSPGFRMCPR